MELFWVLTIAGICVSIVSALENRVQWIASFCAFFGQGCRRTADFTLFRIPVSWWGIGFYGALALVGYYAESWIFWWVMAGFGFELTFLWIMVTIRAFCIFCLFNAAVVVGLVWLYFDPARIWQSAALALFFFVVSNALISRENLSGRTGGPAARPEGIAANMDIEGRPALGPPDARVVVVEFSDPLCPACRKAHETTEKIKAAYGDRIRWVFKDFPLDAHKGAKTAAAAAHCAEEQDKFWQYRDRVFEAGTTPNAEDLKGIAQTLDLDGRQFEQCLASGKYDPQIETDIREGKSAGITATPTFLINGRMISGARSYREFKQEIEQELKRSQRYSSTSE